MSRTPFDVVVNSAYALSTMICNYNLTNNHITSLLVYTAPAPIILIFRSGIVWSFVSVVNCVPFRKFGALIKSHRGAREILEFSAYSRQQRSGAIGAFSSQRYLLLDSGVFGLVTFSIFGGSFFLEPS